MPTNSEIVSALTLYRARANEVGAAAGYGGRMDDGGEGQMLAKADAYDAGRLGLIPSWLAPLIEEALANEARERFEYKRLRAKFEGPASV